FERNVRQDLHLLLPDAATQIKRGGARGARQRQPDPPELLGGVEPAATFIQRDIRDLILGMRLAQMARVKAQEIGRLSGGEPARRFACVRRKSALQLPADAIEQGGWIALEVGRRSACRHAALMCRVRPCLSALWPAAGWLIMFVAPLCEMRAK